MLHDKRRARRLLIVSFWTPSARIRKQQYVVYRAIGGEEREKRTWMCAAMCVSRRVDRFLSMSPVQCVTSAMGSARRAGRSVALSSSVSSSPTMVLCVGPGRFDGLVRFGEVMKDNLVFSSVQAHLTSLEHAHGAEWANRRRVTPLPFQEDGGRTKDPPITHMLSPRMRYSPNGTSSTGSSRLKTLSTEPERMTLVVWSNPLSSP